MAGTAHAMPAAGQPQACSVADLLAEGSSRLQAALNLTRADARLETQLLLARALDVDRTWLIAHDRDLLPPEQLQAVEAQVRRRTRGEPLAYILGEREFYGRSFKVSPDVLIPRPDTELLVEAALERLPQERPTRILDLGTGSGCIAISLALARPDCQVTATDASPAALAIARDNARRLGADRLRFVQSDWYDGLDSPSFAMIVSNPPYIALQDPHLQQGDLRHEPRQALVSGPHGLDAMQHIIARAPAFLAAGGWLLLEHGWDQAAACAREMARAGFADIATLRDLAGRERVTAGRWPGRA